MLKKETRKECLKYCISLPGLVWGWMVVDWLDVSYWKHMDSTI